MHHFVRIRAKRLNKTEYIKLGITRKAGTRGGHTEKIGRVRHYKNPLNRR